MECETDTQSFNYDFVAHINDEKVKNICDIRLNIELAT